MAETTGIVPFWKNYDRKAVLRFAQMAEDLGYDSIWIPRRGRTSSSSCSPRSRSRRRR